MMIGPSVVFLVSVDATVGRVGAGGAATTAVRCRSPRLTGTSRAGSA